MTESPSYPLFLRLQHEPVLVVGGGRLAARRITRLRRSGASVVVVSPRLCDKLADLAERGELSWRPRLFQSDDVAGFRLTVVATNDPLVNQRAVAAARAAGSFVASTDDTSTEPPLGADVILPAVVERDPIQVAVSSDAQAPTLSRRLRARLDAFIPTSYGELARLAVSVRRRLVERLPSGLRTRFWTEVFEGEIAQHVFAGRIQTARRLLAKQVERAEYSGEVHGTGAVFLVGCGPGNPDLLTFRALRVMQRADLVLYDSLVPAAIVALAAPDAEYRHVGKRAERHTMEQGDLNALMAKRALGGERVVRLKGGDPFIFGRGGEEIAELAAAGVGFEVVPGITAASGSAAYAGIPLTHRDYAQSVIFTTGHRQSGPLALSWQTLAKPGQTVVFFMPKRNLTTICRSLIDNGLPGDWPVALVIDATTERQTVHVATLGDWSDPENLPSSVDGAGLAIVGEVVRLQKTHGWFKPNWDKSAD